MKHRLKIRFILLLGIALFFVGKALLYGRWTATRRSVPQRVELSYAEAMADGILTPLEISTHYAPEVHAAVNVLISSSGKGDFISAVDFDGDMSAQNNWEHMTDAPLLAVVYWSVQETEAYYLLTLKGLGIPELISYGQNAKYNILIKTLLDKSLFDLL